jgi:diadenylate cyclase
MDKSADLIERRKPMTDIFNTVKAILDQFWKGVVYGVSEMSPWEFVINLFDILIMSLLFFALYKFVRKRRAGQLAGGLVMLVLLMIICALTGMRGMNFILSNFYQVGILAVIIVFQPELRAALEKVGGKSLVTGLKSITMENKDEAEIKETTDALVSAVLDMSKTKTGALIVLENATKLGEYIQNGKLVEANLSAPLLKNIFFNKAPLHDGAVIVRDFKIHAAACVLPLAEVDNDSFGTRHRAAIGVTEVSDALVIVVSEETGTISVAYQGTITRNYNYDTLYKVVYSFFNSNNVKRHLKNATKYNRRRPKKGEQGSEQ